MALLGGDERQEVGPSWKKEFMWACPLGLYPAQASSYISSMPPDLQGVHNNVLYTYQRVSHFSREPQSKLHLIEAIEEKKNNLEIL
jgi:hypothetical protein